MDVRRGRTTGKLESEFAVFPRAGGEHIPNIAHAMWIHGHSVQAQSKTGITVTRYGYYAEVYGGGEKWLHFAIPTPVFVDDHRLRINSALIRFKCLGNSAVTAVHVRDGEKPKPLVAKSFNLSPKNWYVLRVPIPKKKANDPGKKTPKPPEVEWGIGISVRVRFVVNGSKKILFSSAGCDFVL